jgi:hypothetical protein
VEIREMLETLEDLAGWRDKLKTKVEASTPEQLYASVGQILQAISPANRQQRLQLEFTLEQILEILQDGQEAKGEFLLNSSDEDYHVCMQFTTQALQLVRAADPKAEKIEGYGGAVSVTDQLTGLAFAVPKATRAPEVTDELKSKLEDFRAGKLRSNIRISGG